MKEYKFKINGNSYNVSVSQIDNNTAQVEVNGVPYKVESAAEMAAAAPVVAAPRPAAAPRTESGTPVVARPVQAKGAASAIKSPLPGVVNNILVKAGDEVKAGQTVLILEAMKMENNVNATKSGKVIEVKVNMGESVLEGADLIVIE